MARKNQTDSEILKSIRSKQTALFTLSIISFGSLFGMLFIIAANTAPGCDLVSYLYYRRADKLPRLGRYVLRYAEVHDDVLPGGKPQVKNYEGPLRKDTTKALKGMRPKGSLPLSGLEPYPAWAQEMMDAWEAAGADPRPIREVVKANNDPTNSWTSYDMLLPGVSMRSIPESKWAKTPLLREKNYTGSRGLIFYLDGHTEETKGPHRSDKHRR